MMRTFLFLLAFSRVYTQSLEIKQKELTPLFLKELAFQGVQITFAAPLSLKKEIKSPIYFEGVVETLDFHELSETFKEWIYFAKIYPSQKVVLERGNTIYYFDRSLSKRCLSKSSR